MHVVISLVPTCASLSVSSTVGSGVLVPEDRDIFVADCGSFLSSLMKGLESRKFTLLRLLLSKHDSLSKQNYAAVGYCFTFVFTAKAFEFLRLLEWPSNAHKLVLPSLLTIPIQTLRTLESRTGRLLLVLAKDFSVLPWAILSHFPRRERCSRELCSRTRLHFTR